MPYVPSKDRPALDAAVELVAASIIAKRPSNFELHAAYKKEFALIVNHLTILLDVSRKPGQRWMSEDTAEPIARTVWDAGQQYDYEGAFLGELNYSITRLIQRVPQLMVEIGAWKETDEIRYWLYAMTADALNYVAVLFASNVTGIAGVFADILHEYKWRVNRGYEIAQILKSGDCYDTPFYSRLVEVVDDMGHIGHLEVFVKRSGMTLGKDILNGKLRLS